MAEPTDAPPTTPKPGWFARRRETVLGRRSLVWIAGWFAVSGSRLVVPRKYTTTGSHAWMVDPGLIWMMMAVLLMVPVWFWSRRPLKQARAMDCRMCKHCGYDLRSTDEPGPCPECGRAFAVDELKWYWKDDNAI